MFDRILRWSRNTHRNQITTGEIVPLGRYSDNYKSPMQYQAWDEAIAAHERGDWQDMCAKFLAYIANDNNDNIRWEQRGDSITFTLIQGSIAVLCNISETEFTAHSLIVNYDKPQMGLFRYLLEANHSLRYCKYCINDENQILLYYSTQSEDNGPYKMYYALKEMALVADHHDNPWLKEYPELRAIDSPYIRSSDSFVTKARYEYFIGLIDETIGKIDDQHDSVASSPAELGYVCGSMVYSMDFLLCPQGVIHTSLLEILDLMGRTDTNAAIYLIKGLLMKIRAISYTDFTKEFYIAPYTFGSSKPHSLREVQSIISQHLPICDSYYAGGNMAMAAIVARFAIGKVAYETAPTACVKQLISVYYRVVDHQYTASIGITGLVKDGKVLIDQVVKEWRAAVDEVLKSGVNTKGEIYLLDTNIDNVGLSFLKLILSLREESIS